jgi:hypothetical protein
MQINFLKGVHKHQKKVLIPLLILSILLKEGHKYTTKYALARGFALEASRRAASGASHTSQTSQE